MIAIRSQGAAGEARVVGRRAGAGRGQSATPNSMAIRLTGP